MSPEAPWPWSVLDLTREADARDVRRAYARKLKAIDQATDIEGFSALRSAYDVALRMAEGGAKRPQPVQIILPEPPPEPRPAPKPEPVVIRAEPTEPPPKDPPKPPPVTIELDEPPAPTEPPALDPVRIKADQLRDLLENLSTEVGWSLGGDRIRVALDDPLARDPDTADAVRRGIRNQIVEAFSRSNGTWPASIGKALIKDLDASYGWISDYKAAQRDFFGQQVLLDEMYRQVYGDRFENSASRAEQLRAAKSVRRGMLYARVAYYAPVALFYFVLVGWFHDLLDLHSPLRPVLGIVAIALPVASIVLRKRFLSRMEPYFIRHSRRMAERSATLRDRFRRFLMPIHWRIITRTGWIVALIIVALVSASTKSDVMAGLVGPVILLGIVHEILQSWLNAGRDPIR